MTASRRGRTTVSPPVAASATVGAPRESTTGGAVTYGDGATEVWRLRWCAVGFVVVVGGTDHGVSRRRRYARHAASPGRGGRRAGGPTVGRTGGRAKRYIIDSARRRNGVHAPHRRNVCSSRASYSVSRTCWPCRTAVVHDDARTHRYVTGAFDARRLPGAR